MASDQPTAAGGISPSGLAVPLSSSAVQLPRRSDLMTAQGKTSIADSVVEKIAGTSAS